MSNLMTKERFEKFKNDMLKLSQDAAVLWEQFNKLKTTNDMVVRLARKQKCQMDLMTEDRQKTTDEVKLIKLELRKAHEKIKSLENEKWKSKDSNPKVQDADEDQNDFPAQNTFDLEMLVNDFDKKLAKKEEEESFNYLKRMDMDL